MSPSATPVRRSGSTARRSARPRGAEKIAERARETDPAAQRRGLQTLGMPVSRGQRIDILLDAPGCAIEEAEQWLVWHGKAHSCQFLLAIPREMAGRTCTITARILVGSAPAGKLRFTLAVDGQKPTGPADLVGEIAQRYRMAFLSHSHEDRVRVFAFAQLLDALGVRYFQDIALVTNDGPLGGETARSDR